MVAAQVLSEADSRGLCSCLFLRNRFGHCKKKKIYLGVKQTIASAPKKNLCKHFAKSEKNDYFS